MQADVISPTYISIHKQYATYNNILTSSVSTTNSTWSDTSSQSSDDTSVSSTSDSDSCDPYYRKPAALAHAGNYQSSLSKPVVSEALPKELRQNPRRSGSRARGACPPALVRQCDRKVNFVDSLVDSSTQIVEAIWPLSSAACRSELGSKAVLPLRTFIQETLRRSRTSYSTLQVALYYLILIKPHVPKYNFTMEQPEDRHADRALQCGRRMFLAALILASKYLQDRNYSARAWSKISGLNTHEINQNEMSFLLAVNWKLHIADEVFQRWTEIVLKYTPPPSPPSPGATPTVSQQSIEWRNLILRLNPELTNIDGIFPLPDTKRSDLCAFSPRSILNPPVDSRATMAAILDATASKAFTSAPIAAVESTSTPAYSAGHLAPALGLLPTPRLTPQTNGLCTPAVSAGSYKKPSAMCIAMAQASSVTSAHHLDRLPISVTSPPQSYCPARRSSLANSVSAASSPESMISDVSRSSRSSRSSSISSVSSLASAGVNSKLMTSRFRGAVGKAMNERSCQKPTVPSVPENFDDRIFSSSPESYTGPVTKLGSLSLDTPLARREEELEEFTRDPVCDAARTLQNLHNEDMHSADSTPTGRVSRKRTRPTLVDDVVQEEDFLQENVRHLLHGTYPAPEPMWKMLPSHKRLCCSTEAASGFLQAANPRSVLHQGQGIWDGILN